MLSTFSSSATSLLPDQQAKMLCLAQVKELIKSRMRFNHTVGNYLTRAPLNDAIYFIASHFYKLGSKTQIALLISFDKKSIRSKVELYRQACKGDANNFERMLYCFKLDDIDHTLNELFSRAHLMLKLTGRDDDELISESKYYHDILKLVEPYIDRKLFSFCLSTKKIDIKSSSTYHCELDQKELSRIIEKGKLFLTTIKSINFTDYYSLNKNIQFVTQKVQSNKPFTDLDVALVLYACYSVHQILEKYKDTPLRTKILPVITKSLSSITISPPLTTAPIIPLDYPKTDEISGGYDEISAGSEVAVPLSYSYEHYKKAQKGSLKKPSDIPTASADDLAKEERLEYYRDKLKRFKDLLFLIFRPNTPNFEVKWDETERLLTAIGAKISSAEGSRKTLVFNENTVNQRWASILQPVEFSQRGIHHTHRKNRTCNELADIYVEILQTALSRFGVSPYLLWPDENQDLAEKYKSKLKSC